MRRVAGLAVGILVAMAFVAAQPSAPTAYDRQQDIRIASLEAALQSPAPSTRATPPPVLSPPPTATPAASGLVASVPLNVPPGAHDVVIDGKAFSAAYGSGVAITAVGTQANAIVNLTVRRSAFKGFFIAIQAEWVTNLVVEDDMIDGAEYAGVLAVSPLGGTISRNTIRKIGQQTQQKVGDPEVDAYGIALTDRGGRVAQGVTCDRNVIEDVPVWQGMNAHNGIDITWTNNIVRRTRRAFWMAPTGSNRILRATLVGNRAEATWVTYDPTAFFVMNTDDSVVRDGFVSTTFPVGADGGEWLNFVRDYGQGSINLTRTGTVRG